MAGGQHHGWGDPVSAPAFGEQPWEPPDFGKQPMGGAAELPWPRQTSSSSHGRGRWSSDPAPAPAFGEQPWRAVDLEQSRRQWEKQHGRRGSGRGADAEEEEEHRWRGQGQRTRTLRPGCRGRGCRGLGERRSDLTVQAAKAAVAPIREGSSGNLELWSMGGASPSSGIPWAASQPPLALDVADRAALLSF
jgi:hypothetical protein